MSSKRRTVLLGTLVLVLCAGCGDALPERSGPIVPACRWNGPAVQPFLLDGFDELEHGREGRWRWTLGRSGVVGLWLEEPAAPGWFLDGELQPFGHLPSPQTLEVFLDGRRISQQSLRRRWSRIRIPLDPALLPAGFHRLELRAGQVRSPAAAGEEDVREISIRWRRLTVGPGPDALDWVSTPPLDLAFGRAVRLVEELRPGRPVRTESRIEAVVPAGKHALHLSILPLTTPPPTLIVSWSEPDGPTREIHRMTPRVGAGWTDLNLRLPPEGPGSIELTFLGEPFGSLVLSDVRILRIREEQRPDIVLISLDTLRASFLGSYGDPERVTPHLDRLARKATQYSDASVPAPWTLPTHATLMLGRRPLEHGVGYERAEIRPNERPLAAWLTHAGYRTTGISSASILDSKFGFDIGFSVYFDFLAAPRKTDQTFRLARQFSRADPTRPFFLFLHLFDAHAPYEPPWLEARRFDTPRVITVGSILTDDSAGLPPPETLNTWRRGYRAELAALDRRLGHFIAALQQRPAERKLALAVVSDHGELFGEHGAVGHAYHLYEDLVRAVLLVDGPEMGSARLEPGPRELRSIHSTILRWAGVTRPEGAPQDLETKPATVVISEERHGVVHPILGIWGVRGSRFALRRGDRKLFAEGDYPPLVFDLARDRAETRPRPADPHRDADLLDDLRRYLGHSAVPLSGTGEEPDAEQIDALRALGYVGD